MSFRLFQSFVLNSFFRLFSYDIVNWLKTCCVTACWLASDQVKILLLLINRYLSKYLFECDSDLRSLFNINQSERGEDGYISYTCSFHCPLHWNAYSIYDRSGAERNQCSNTITASRTFSTSRNTSQMFDVLIHDMSSLLRNILWSFVIWARRFSIQWDILKHTT